MKLLLILWQIRAIHIEERYNGTIVRTYSKAQFSSNPYASYLVKDGDKVTLSTTETAVTHSGTTLDFSNLKASNIKELINKKNPQGFFSTCCTCTRKYSINFVDNKGNGSTQKISGIHFIYDIDIHSLLSKPDVKGEDLTKLVISELINIEKNNEIKTDDGFSYGVQLQNHFTAMTSEGNKLIIYDARPNKYSEEQSKVIQGLHGFGGSASASERMGLFGIGVYYSTETVERYPLQKEALHIQVGANSYQDVEIPWPNISTNRLGIETVPMLITEGASMAIDVIDEAITIVSKHRSEYGAYQNRLEYAQRNADNSAENLQAAESRIRDTNIEKEMVQYSKEKILEQASIAILSHTKANREGILTLFN